MRSEARPAVPPARARDGARLLLAAASLLALSASAADLKVMATGLGSGTVTGPGISCSSAGGDCDEAFTASASVTLTATPAAGSTFAGWSVELEPEPTTPPDCSGTASTCTLAMGVARSVRPRFDLVAGTVPPLTAADPTNITPAELQAYLTANPSVNTVARFVAALPAQYRESAILMTRSESLQTGTAEHPRILLSSTNAKSVFSIGPSEHASYPGSHPDVVEYMQWDPATKNFRFHEVILTFIPAMPNGIPERLRKVEADDAKCAACHSTRNVVNRVGVPGTDGIPPGSIQVKNKPNWDPYDSWGGMLAFNRDRIYQGSVEAAAFRRLLNPWTWRSSPAIRAVVEQLRLQPSALPAGSLHRITRVLGGAGDGTPRFTFDTATPVTSEPAPVGSDPAISTAYLFNDTSAGTASAVTRGGAFVLLTHVSDPAGGAGEGRGVQLFDLLGGLDGSLNQQRIADELARHRWATGSVYVDPRPVALAINKGCVRINSAMDRVESTTATPLTVNLAFFTARNGLGINALFADTQARTRSIPRRKADIEKLNLSRTSDLYTALAEPEVPGLVQLYGGSTTSGTDTSLARLRREVFRRPNDLGSPDATSMGGIYVDREIYSSNTPAMTLYRYFLEPLGVSVDKWSLGVRGRSRAYGFADVFGSYQSAIRTALEASLTAEPVAGLAAPFDCNALVPAVNSTLASLPAATAVPRYMDVQRIFNKACIECHGGLEYPPYVNYGSGFNLAEDHSTPGLSPLGTPHALASAFAGSLSAPIYDRITRTSEDCPTGMMPCGGPPLSKTDVETIRRWIVGGNPDTVGDPHLKTVDGVRYDFQAAGEFVLLRDPGLELQARHTPVQTQAPVGPDAHTGLTACPSLTTAVAARLGKHRVSYAMNPWKPEALELRIDGKLVQVGGEYLLDGGGRVTGTPARGGILLESAGGTRITVTVEWWAHYRVWYMNVTVKQARATEGLLGSVAPRNWLPALPDGSQLGVRPAALQDRHAVLYKKLGDAWRVTEKSSLFDYTDGLSTADYTLWDWPVFGAQACKVGQAPKGIPVAEPLPPLPVEKAAEVCRSLVDAARRKACTQDVAGTGDPALATAYFVTEKVERNVAPSVPTLAAPRDHVEGVATQLGFKWEGSYDTDQDPVTYRHCIWKVDAPYSYRACGKPTRETYAVAYLEPGQAYFWKVVAEDGKGGTTESKTWRLTTK